MRSKLLLKEVYNFYPLVTEKSRDKIENVKLDDDATNIKKLIEKYGEKLFVTFTAIDKIGINPRSRFNTPLGVYCYPVNMFEINSILTGDMPFTGNSQWEHIIFFTLKHTHKTPFIYEDGLSDLDITFKKYVDSLIKQHNEASYWAQETKLKTDFGRFWNITRNLADGNIAKWNKILRDFNIDAVVDYGSGIIHQMEPVQAVILNPSLIQPVYKVDRQIQKEKIIINTSNVKDILKYGPEKLLSKVISSDNQAVRETAAKYSKLPKHIMMRMVKDKSGVVRRVLAQNENIPIEVQKILAQDKSVLVRSGLAKNKEISLDTQMLLAQDKEYDTRSSLSRNKNCESEVLDFLSNDTELMIKICVIAHPNTSKQTLEKLAMDADPSIKLVANSILNKDKEEMPESIKNFVNAFNTNNIFN